MHDTQIDGTLGELYRSGYNNYDELYNYAITVSNKINLPVNELLIGLQRAINEFLSNNSDWVLNKEYQNNNGLTILRRKSL
jgi:hypothetical protein